jgi:predicted nucleotidyltransferase
MKATWGSSIMAIEEGEMSTHLTRNRILALLSEHASEIKQRFHVRRLGVFGSYVREEPRPGSDVDILVEFESPTFDNYMDLKFFLEDMFHKDVDLVMADTLKP